MDPEPTPPAGASTPYRDAAHTYRAAGWVGVLPVPHGTKRLRAVGWTGHNGAWPSTADIHTWCDSDRRDEGGGNIALRLPPDVIGIDVDNYDGKRGADTLADAVHTWGPLPHTWMSSARDDGISKIRLFRVPEGLKWPGELGPHVEIIQTRHRYMMVWPSLHPAGSTYRWYRPDGLATMAVPHVDDLPHLPDTWVAGLTGGELAENVAVADLTLPEIAGWLKNRPAGDPCRGMRAVTQHLLDDLEHASAHDALKHLMAIVRFAEQGHLGLPAALTQAKTAFLTVVTDTGRKNKNARSRDEAEAEWLRSLAGAVRRVRGDTSVADSDTPDDPCRGDDTFTGLVADPAPATDVPTLAPAPPPAELTPLQQRQLQGDDEKGADSIRTHDEDSDDWGSLEDLIAPVPGGGPAPPNTTTTDTTTTDSAGSATGTGRSTWWPVDLTPILDGTYEELVPTVMARSDGQHLFYPGKINGLLGESESGKSWILLAAVVQQLHAGLPALYVDFEDDARSVVARILALGCDPAYLRADKELFFYVSPDSSLNTDAALDLHELLAARRYSLIAVDGVNAAMTLLGLNLIDNGDATKFFQRVLRPLAATGAAVVTVDHVSKDKETRGKGGIGAQAKRAMVTGAAYMVDVVAPFGRGQSGKLRLTVDKDRPGFVRGFSENSKNAGVVIIESFSNGSVSLGVEPSGAARAAAPVADKFRPTGVMERISRLLSTTDGMLGQNQIEHHVGGKASTVRAALECLVEEGFVSRHPGPRNSLLHRYERTFRELDDLTDPTTGGDGW